MPISMPDSFIAEKALDYAKLSDFAYAKWGVVNGEWGGKWGQIFILDKAAESRTL